MQLPGNVVLLCAGKHAAVSERKNVSIKPWLAGCGRRLNILNIVSKNLTLSVFESNLFVLSYTGSY